MQVARSTRTEKIQTCARTPPAEVETLPRRSSAEPESHPKGVPKGPQPGPNDPQKGPQKGDSEIGPEKGVHLPCDPRPEGPQTLQIPRFFGFGHPGRHTRVWGLPAPILGPIFGVPGCSRLNVDAARYLFTNIQQNSQIRLRRLGKPVTNRM